MLKNLMWQDHDNGIFGNGFFELDRLPSFKPREKLDSLIKFIRLVCASPPAHFLLLGNILQFSSFAILIELRIRAYNIYIYKIIQKNQNI